MKWKKCNICDADGKDFPCLCDEHESELVE